MIQLKISFFGDFAELPTEGRFTFVLNLKRGLEQNGFKVSFNDLNADIIHAHSSGIFLSRKISKIKKKYKKPCIYSLYSTCESKFSEYLKYYQEQWSYFQNELSLKHCILASSSIIPLEYKRKWLKNLDLVIVPSQYIQAKLFENTKVIHIGIDIDKFRSNAKEEKRDEIITSFIGANNSGKGFLDFAEATKRFNNPKMVFKAFITEIPNKLRKYTASINDQIELYEKQRVMSEVYNKSDIIVLPYRMSLAAIANPLVLLEAMSCERGIVTTNLPNIREIVKDSGLLVDPYSPEQIADKISIFRDENLRTKLGKRAREIIKERYNEKKMVKEYIKVYDELI